jgi:hypothetical protein
MIRRRAGLSLPLETNRGTPMMVSARGHKEGGLAVGPKKMGIAMNEPSAHWSLEHTMLPDLSTPLAALSAIICVLNILTFDPFAVRDKSGRLLRSNKGTHVLHVCSGQVRPARRQNKAYITSPRSPLLRIFSHVASRYRRV